MKKQVPLIDGEGEVREITMAEMRRFRPAHEVLPPSMHKMLGIRGPQKAPPKVATTLRFDADVLAALKASGPGWQTRVNAVVRDWAKKERLV